jgi:glycosyltransferase involved in cell wall biosynthesis
VFATIVIPAHNEERSLDQLSQELEVAVGQLDHEVEVLFVDDASTDATPEVLAAVCQRNPAMRVLTLEQQSGQTGAFQAAFAEARGEYIIRMDADLQDHPADLAQFFPHLEAGADLVIGMRSLRRHRRLLRLASMFYDASAVLLLDSPLHIHTTSFLAVRSRFVQGIVLRKNDHRHLPLIAMQRGATRIAEVVVRNRDRKYGKSNYNNFVKLTAGIPEVLLFFLRVKTGYYGAPSKPGE